MTSAIPPHRLDLCGIPCPVNWAHARAAIAGMRRGELLEVVVDDPRSEADLPRAAEAAGHAVLEVLREGAAIRILIEI